MPRIGFKHSEESKRKMSEIRKGVKKSSSWIKKLKKRMKGNKFTLGRKLSKEHIEKIRKSSIGKHRDDKNYFWKGGITPINKKIRSSTEYKLWRTAVFERDKYICTECGVRSKKDFSIELNADHIKPFAYFPELRFAIDNGRTLCRKCHLETDTFGEKAKSYGKK